MHSTVCEHASAGVQWSPVESDAAPVLDVSVGPDETSSVNDVVDVSTAESLAPVVVDAVVSDVAWVPASVVDDVGSVALGDGDVGSKQPVPSATTRVTEGGQRVGMRMGGHGAPVPSLPRPTLRLRVEQRGTPCLKRPANARNRRQHTSCSRSPVPIARGTTRVAIRRIHPAAGHAAAPNARRLSTTGSLPRRIRTVVPGCFVDS